MVTAKMITVPRRKSKKRRIHLQVSNISADLKSSGLKYKINKSITTDVFELDKIELNIGLIY